MENYAKLILKTEAGEEKSYSLAKTTIAIGRGALNDIVLSDTRISRNHVHLEYDGKQVTLRDNDSANGTFVNGERVQQKVLSPGDLVTLGTSTLRYELATVEDEAELTVIDSAGDLDETLATGSFPTTIRDTQTSHLVIQTAERTWEIPLTQDKVEIGRHPDCQVCIPSTRISRRHAIIEAQDDSFIIKDLGSANGTWIKNQAIQEHRLENGETIIIGDATLVFKQGFLQDELTLVDKPGEREISERRSVVFVPGLMGSELWLGQERVWPNVSAIFSHPELFRFPGDTPLEARKILDEVIIVPNLIKLEQYGRLGDFMEEALGYQRGVDLLEFAYDWRQDVRESAKKLAQVIDSGVLKLPITIIAHSLGTLVSRYYVECLGGKDKVERLLLMGGPAQGAPKAVSSLLTGSGLLPLGLMGDKLRDLMVTFPSMYQILPTYNCMHDQNNQPVNLFQDKTWLPVKYHPLLLQAEEFKRELGLRSSVPTVSIFGYGIKTISQFSIQRIADKWQKLEIENKPAGDATVPEISTILPGTEIHPVQQYHGSLYVDNDVKMRLKLELTRII
jgi:pSer/pThr/pTyr-binding forkhead associated (FHA) protein